MEPWKLEKLRELTNEVQQLHPLLRAVFSSDQSIQRFEYTHGQSEMGADFVLARLDPTFADENYVGVIVKCGAIKQDYSTIKRQIEECAVERYFDGGKKKIYLNEVWIICNGSISNGAERKIHEEYKARNIKFIDLDRLALLVQTNYPHYWNEIPTDLGLYLQQTLINVVKVDSFNALPGAVAIPEIEQELVRIEQGSKGTKLPITRKQQRYKLSKAIELNRLTIIEGGMGSGKSTLLRRHIRALCDPTTFQQTRIVPAYFHFSELRSDLTAKLEEIIRNLEDFSSSLSGQTQVLVVDGLDEVKEDSDQSILLTVDIFTNALLVRPNLSIVIGSRPVWTVEEGEAMLVKASRFRILPLTFDQLYKLVQQSCTKFSVSDRLRQDLAKSNLVRALPLTPMSALLLARVLSANAKEIPQTLPELYSKYVELALGRWDISKGLMTEREYPVVVAIISQVAKYMLDNEIQELAVSEVLQMLHEYTSTREGLPPPADILKRISHRSEIVYIDQERQIFAFRHKSFSEYLLALHQKENYGRAAPLTNPFEGYWLGVEYFYLGLIQDAGKRIDKLSRLDLHTDREKILRLLNFGNLMLAAHQTEYSHIEKAVYLVNIEMARYFIGVRDGKISSNLAVLPELQFFATLSFALRNSFEYPFFAKALETAQIQCQCDLTLTDEERIVASFFIDTSRAGLGEQDVFRFITERPTGDLPWVVKLGVYHVANDDGLLLEHIDRLVKRISKSRKGNSGLNAYIHALYSGSMSETRPKIADGNNKILAQ